MVSMLIKLSTGESGWAVFVKIAPNREMSYSFIYDIITQKIELLTDQRHFESNVQASL